MVWLGLLMLSGGCASGVRKTLEPASATPTAHPSSPTATGLAPVPSTPTVALQSVALTEPGCCSRPWWSEDGAHVLFVDDPPGEKPLGVYSVPSKGGVIQLETALGADPAGTLALALDPTQSAVDGFRLPQSAQQIRLSPDRTSVAWTEGSTQISNLDTRQRLVYVKKGIALPRQRVAILVGGDLLDWSDDGTALLVTGGLVGETGRGIWSVPVDGSSPRQVAETGRVRGGLLSPKARWLAFYQALESDPRQNGVWVVRLSDGAVHRIDGLASYRWAGDDRLLFIPYDPSGDLGLWELQLTSGVQNRIGGTELFPDGIAANLWSVSPDGDRLLYRSAADDRLYAVEIANR